MRTSSVLGGTLIVLSLTGFGCNPFASFQAKVNEKIGQTVAEKALEAASGGKANVDLSNGGVTVTDPKTGETASFGADVKLPSGFPTDVPMYDGAKITVVSNSASNGAVLAVQISSNDANAVSGWYDQKFKAEGFTTDSETSASQSLFKEYKKDNITMDMALIGPLSGDNGVSIIQVQISRQVDTSATQ